MDNVASPICPFMMYFQGDENKCDSSKCDYDPECRACSQKCEIPTKVESFESLQEELILERNRLISRGWGIEKWSKHLQNANYTTDSLTALHIWMNLLAACEYLDRTIDACQKGITQKLGST